MASTPIPANEAALTEPLPARRSGMFGAGWVSELVCALAVVPAIGMASGELGIGETASWLACVAALGVVSLALQRRG